MSGKTFLLQNPETDDQVELNVHSGTVGPDVLDIRSLYASTGTFTYDSGFAATASCKSKITYIDGGKGLLMYRGYPVEQLAEKSSFIEVCYLLLYGELPSADELVKFDETVRMHTMLNALTMA